MDKEEPVSVRSEAKEVATELIGWQGWKLWRTVRGLTINPGQVIREYCQGEKQKYLSPVVYLFALSGVAFYLQSVFGVEAVTRMTEDYVTIFKEIGIELDPVQLEKAVGIFFNQTASMIFSLAPNLIIHWLLFRKHERSFKNNSWFIFFTAAQCTLILMPVLVMYWFDLENLLASLGLLLTVALYAYTIWAAKQFYRIQVRTATLLMLLKFVILVPINFGVMAAAAYLVYTWG